MRVIAIRDERPHRELTLEFAEVNVGEEVIPLTLVKLVEHEGRAGLVLIAPPGLPSPITQWEPQGEDERGAYVLLIPSDAGGSKRLAQLGSRNWQMVLALASLVQQTLRQGIVGVAIHWVSVASRLWVDLNALPVRLRYDELAVSIDGEAVTLRLDGAWYGDRLLPPIALVWTPNQAGAPVRWFRTDPNTPLLSAWPVLADGELAPELVLPLHRHATMGARLRWWTNLLPADRELAVAVLDTLSVAPLHLSGRIDSAKGAKLAAEAISLQAALRRTLKLGRLARRMQRSVRGQPEV